MQHLDEGTIHAWLDGALAPNEASAAEAHVQTCVQCATAVAEARGLIAASSRILSALDDVPAVQEPRTLPLARRRASWWRRAGFGYAAAATALLAVGTTLVLRSTSRNAVFDAAPVAVDESPRPAETTRPPIDTSAFRTAPSNQRLVTVPQKGAGAAPSAGVTRAKNAKEREPKKEELAVDRIVPLPGPLPRPAAPSAAGPPPSVRQEQRKAVADMAVRAAEREQGAVVQGRVLDATTGAPVVGAVVSLDTARVARTDSEGKFKLQPVPLGQQTVSVRALGFQSAQHQVAVAARDSVDLGFTLQKTAAHLQSAVTTGAAAAREEDRARAGLRDSLQALRRAAPPILRLDDVRTNAANILGCYTLRAVAGADKDAQDAVVRSLPARVQLEAQPRERAQSNEALLNRARSLEGPGRAESWRFVGDSLELAWMDGARRRVMRFAREDVRWIGLGVVLERCDDTR